MSTTSRRQHKPSQAFRRGSNEFLGILVSCIGAYSMFLGVLPQLARGTVGMFLLGTALLVGGLHVVLGPRQGKTIGRSLFEVLAVSALTFGLVYGCMWYFTVYLTSQPDVMKFNLSATTATP